jgi:colicin import membrane protein
MTVFERARTGLREMPSNAAWLLSKAANPAEGAASGVRDQGRRVTAAVVDAAPVGDSVEIRVRRARDAAEHARDAEARAVEAAREAKGLAEIALQVSERGRARINEVERETSREVKQRVAEAERAAAELIRGEREAAEADAEDELREVEEEVEDEIAEATGEAEASQQRAEELVEDATEALAEARQLAEEAADAARAAAEDANRQAEQLRNEAEQRADETESRVKEAEQLRHGAAATAKQAARELDRETTEGGLDAYRKPELVELASTIGIEGRSSMTKDELVDAITKQARRHARQGARQ